MKLRLLPGAIAMVLGALLLLSFQRDTKKEPWTAQQLMPASELAAKISNNKLAGTVIFNIGPSGQIKNAVDIGPAQEAENLALLKKKLGQLPKTTEVVIYCGCCPFQNCPNIRPAFELLNDMKFTNAKLLNLPANLKVDWINKGYPMQH